MVVSGAAVSKRQEYYAFGLSEQLSRHFELPSPGS